MGADNTRVSPEGTPDKLYPFADANDANLVRRLVVEAFGQAGVPGSDRGDHFLADDGKEANYHDILVMCLLGTHQEDSWRKIVNGYVTRVFVEGARSGILTDHVEEPLLEMALPIMVRSDLVDSDPWKQNFLYAMWHSPSVRVILALEDEESLRYVTDRMLEGHDVDKIGRRPTENLWSNLRGRHVGLGDPESPFHIFEGDLFASAYAMDIQRLVARLDPDSPREIGFVYSIPRQNVVCWINLERTKASKGALNSLLSSTLKQYQDFKAPLSLELIWCHEGTNELVNEIKDGAFQFRSTERFGPVLDALRSTAT